MFLPKHPDFYDVQFPVVDLICVFVCIMRIDIFFISSMDHQLVTEKIYHIFPVSHVIVKIAMECDNALKIMPFIRFNSWRTNRWNWKMETLELEFVCYSKMASKICEWHIKMPLKCVQCNRWQRLRVKCASCTCTHDFHFNPIWMAHFFLYGLRQYINGKNSHFAWD